MWPWKLLMSFSTTSVGLVSSEHSFRRHSLACPGSIFLSSRCQNHTRTTDKVGQIQMRITGLKTRSSQTYFFSFFGRDRTINYAIKPLNLHKYRLIYTMSIISINNNADLESKRWLGLLWKGKKLSTIVFSFLV